MPRNGNGTYSPPPSSWNPAINGNAATAPDWNALRIDIANALTQSVSRDGQSPMTANLPMGGNRVTGVGQPIDDTDAIRRAQIVKGTDLASASTLGIPIEGSLFDVTGTTSISAISDVYPGRIVVLRFMDSLTLEHSADFLMPNGSDVKVSSGDMAVMVNTEFGRWACISYQTFDTADDIWRAQPIGMPFPIWDNISGVPVPPTNSPNYRYIKLTAGDSYNSGVLINEVVTGSSPNVNASATISLAGSPMNGAGVFLINTERNFLRAGSSGSKQDSQNISHFHTASMTDVVVSVSGYFAGDDGLPDSGLTLGPAVFGPATNPGVVTTLPHNHVITVQNAGGNEARPRNIGVTYYMRIM